MDGRLELWNGGGLLQSKAYGVSALMKHYSHTAFNVYVDGMRQFRNCTNYEQAKGTVDPICHRKRSELIRGRSRCVSRKEQVDCTPRILRTSLVAADRRSPPHTIYMLLLDVKLWHFRLAGYAQ